MKVDVKQIAKLPANVLAKEARLFLIFSYLAIWMCLPVMSMMDLKASTPVLDLIDDIYLIQLYFVVWFFMIITLYVIRLLIYFLEKRFG
jgi:hypothetical protein